MPWQGEMSTIVLQVLSVLFVPWCSEMPITEIMSIFYSVCVYIYIDDCIYVLYCKDIYWQTFCLCLVIDQCGTTVTGSVCQSDERELLPVKYKFISRLGSMLFRNLPYKSTP